MLKRVVIAAAALTLGVASSLAAQTQSTSSGSASASQNQATQSAMSSQAAPSTQSTTSGGSTTTSDDVQTRPATTTFMGDTGLWYVPTGEVLPRKKWSISAYRVNFDDNQGFTDVSNWPLTFGIGVGGRAEIFGSFNLVTRVDRDVVPLFVSSVPGAGGVVPQNPLQNSPWSGNQLGDFWVGGKWSLTSESRQQPAAFALRAMVKIK